MKTFGGNVDKFMTSTGQFCRVTFTSEKRPAAKHKGRKLVKRTNGLFRSGIQFKNLGAVKEGIAAGERGEVQPLPWGQWVEYPYIIEHKGTFYIRLYPPHKRNDDGRLVPCWNESQLSIEYYVDDKAVNKEEFNSFLTPSDAKKGDDRPDCFTVKSESIEALG
jgi:hypothetical protein